MGCLLLIILGASLLFFGLVPTAAFLIVIVAVAVIVGLCQS